MLLSVGTLFTSYNKSSLFLYISGLMGMLLQGVDYPEVYLSNKKNHYCFFTQDDFSSYYLSLKNLHIM